VQVFGAGQYAMRCWVNPNKLSSLGVTVTEIINAIQTQNNVNPAGQIGGEPVPAGQQSPITHARRDAWFRPRSSVRSSCGPNPMDPSCG